MAYHRGITLAVSREQAQLGGEKRGGSDQGRCSGPGGGEWLAFGSIPKAEPTGFPDGADVGLG